MTFEFSFLLTCLLTVAVVSEMIPTTCDNVPPG